MRITVALVILIIFRIIVVMPTNSLSVLLYFQKDMKSLINKLVNNINSSKNNILKEITNEQIVKANRDDFKNYYDFESICKNNINLDNEESVDLVKRYKDYRACQVYTHLA